MNWGMLGHQWAVKLLKDQAANNTYRHAYLFTGPKGIGRRTLALKLAQALNCPQPTSPGEPCLKCHTCTRINDMRYPDLAVVQSDHEGRTLKVDQVRDLQHVLSLSPYEARKRVALLLRFEEASIGAANALLKTLEEPPPQVVLVISAESGDRLLPTIVSRCEVLRLRPIPVDEVSKGLQSNLDLPSERAELLAHISGGRPGYAIRLHTEPKMLTKRNNWLDELQHLIPADRVERFAFAESQIKDKDTLYEMLPIWLSYWRDVLLVSINTSLQLTNLDRKDEINNLANKIDVGQTRHFVARLQRSFDLLNHNVNTRLLTEALLLELPRG